MIPPNQARRQRLLGAIPALVALLLVAACIDAGSAPASSASDPPDGASSSGPRPTATPTSPLPATLVVTGRGTAHCPNPPFTCFIGFVVGPPDLPVPDTWEPSADDPSFDHTTTGSGRESVEGGPRGIAPSIPAGRHTLIGFVSAISDVVDGEGPSTGPTTLWTFTCRADLDVGPEIDEVRIAVQFVAADDPTCGIAITKR